MPLIVLCQVQLEYTVSQVKWDVETSIYSRAGSVSVFGVGIGISEILVENRKFLVPHLYLAPLLRVTPSEFHSRVPFWKTRMMGPPGDEKV